MFNRLFLTVLGALLVGCTATEFTSRKNQSTSLAQTNFDSQDPDSSDPLDPLGIDSFVPQDEFVTDPPLPCEGPFHPVRVAYNSTTGRFYNSNGPDLFSYNNGSDYVNSGNVSEPSGGGGVLSGTVNGGGFLYPHEFQSDGLSSISNYPEIRLNLLGSASLIRDINLLIIKGYSSSSRVRLIKDVSMAVLYGNLRIDRVSNVSLLSIRPGVLIDAIDHVSMVEAAPTELMNLLGKEICVSAVFVRKF